MLAILASTRPLWSRGYAALLLLPWRGPLSEVPVGGILMPLLGEKIHPPDC